MFQLETIYFLSASWKILRISILLGSKKWKFYKFKDFDLLVSSSSHHYFVLLWVGNIVSMCVCVLVLTYTFSPVSYRLNWIQIFSRKFKWKQIKHQFRKKNNKENEIYHWSVYSKYKYSKIIIKWMHTNSIQIDWVFCCWRFMSETRLYIFSKLALLYSNYDFMLHVSIYLFFYFLQFSFCIFYVCLRFFSSSSLLFYLMLNGTLIGWHYWLCWQCFALFPFLFSYKIIYVVLFITEHIHQRT